MFGLFGNKRIYLDHASATPVLREAADAVRAASEYFGNPGATHVEALDAKKILNESRERIACILECKAREIIFTSGLTEANNLAIVGLARSMQMDGKDLKMTHWLVSAIEHDSILECFSEIERLGGKVTHLDPDDRGIISPEKVAQAVRGETVLVSIGWGNNEIGVVQPLKKISAAIKEKNHRTLLHSDAGQAPLYIHPHPHTLGVDMFSLGSGKLYGPRGIGALYVNNRVELAPVLLGGGQERNLRAGTEEPALAAGFAEAFEIVSRERDGEEKRLREMRDFFAREIARQFSHSMCNTDLDHSLPHMLNVSFPGINAEYTALVLDRKGIAVSTKSACNEGVKDSHVVAALGGESWRAGSTIRFSLGRSTTRQDIERVLVCLREAIRKGNKS